MTDYFGNVQLMLQNLVTFLMTLVLILLAAVTIIGFILFFINRFKFNKYMFVGFVLFTICSIVFTRVFGYRMEFFQSGMSQIMMYALWYIFWFDKPGTPPPPEDGGQFLCLLLICF